MSKSLYERLGEEKGLSAIVADALAKHQKNPEISPRFQDIDLPKFTKLAIDFFGAGIGGPQTYSGKDMKTAHKNMNISQGEYMAVIDDIMAAMNNHNIDRDTQNEVLGILYSLKGEVVGQ